MSGFVGERCGDPVVSCRALTSVTEMIANLGSTASSNVSATLRGGALTKPLADGTVLHQVGMRRRDAGQCQSRDEHAPAEYEPPPHRHASGRFPPG